MENYGFGIVGKLLKDWLAQGWPGPGPGSSWPGPPGQGQGQQKHPWPCLAWPADSLHTNILFS